MRKKDGLFSFLVFFGKRNGLLFAGFSFIPCPFSPAPFSVENSNSAPSLVSESISLRFSISLIYLRKKASIFGIDMEVLSKSGVISPCGHRSVVRSCKERSPCFVGFPRSSSRTIGSLMSSSRNSGFHGRRLTIGARRVIAVKGNFSLPPVQMSLCVGKALKWWEKDLQPNMKEIESAQDLVASLSNAGDKLVIVDFLSPGCGGCKALHPKICQFAKLNPDVLFLQVNYEKHKSMCYSLNVHVLPFFRFYRGAHGRLCSFSCTNATIKKFKDALAKHTTDRCSLGPTKGLEESELMALAANRDLSFNYPRKPVPVPSPDEAAEQVPVSPKLSVSSTPRLTQDSEEKALVAAGR